MINSFINVKQYHVRHMQNNVVQCKQKKDLHFYNFLWFPKGYASLLYLFPQMIKEQVTYLMLFGVKNVHLMHYQ